MKRFLTPAILLALSLTLTLSPLFAVRVAALDTNLVPNASVETASSTNSNLPSGWQSGGWGTNTAIFSYDSTGHSGSRSVKTQITSYTSGDAKWYFTPQAITAGTRYSFSDYYKSTTVTHIVAQFGTSGGTNSYVDLGAVAANADWTQATTTFAAPAGATNVTIFHLIDSVGTLSVDDAALSVTPTVTDSNLVANASAETPNPLNTAQPQYWRSSKWGTNTTAFSYLASGAHTGSRALETKVTAYTSGDAKWYFEPIAVTPGSQYRFSDFYKATVATDVVAAFTMPDGSIKYQSIGLPETSSTAWSKFSTTFTVPLGAVNMTVFHLIQSKGTLTIDDASLTSYAPVGFQRALVSLTFDDGYASSYTNGLPLLQKYGFSSTQFIVSGLVDTPNYMTTAQVKAFSVSGSEIGSHTVTHPDMTTLTRSQYDNQLKNSQTKLQQMIGKPVTNFAFPEGRYNQAIINDAKPLYTSTRGVEAGLNSKDAFNAYDIKVQNIDSTTTAAEVADWVNQALATKTWLVIVYHAVVTNGDEYSVTPANLDTQLALIKNSNAAVVTVQQALAEITPQL